MLYSKDKDIRSKAFIDLSKGLKKFQFSKIDKADRLNLFVALFGIID